MKSFLNLSLTVNENIDRIEKAVTAELANRENYLAAIEDYSALLVLEPFNPLLYRNRGHRYLSISQFQKAAADLEMGTRLDPGYWKNWNYLGMIYYFLGQFERAITYYERAMAVTGVHSVYYVAMVNWKYLCLCHLGKKDTDEAKALIAQITPETTPAIDNYKQLILMNNGTISAQEIEDKLPDFDDIDFSTYSCGLAMHYYFHGQERRGKEMLAKTLETAKAWYALGYMGCQAENARLAAK